MKLQSTLALVFLLFTARSLIASNTDFERANALYAEGKFEEAIAVYESLIGSGYRSADLHFNLGNAYYRQRALGAAILHYERALRFSPADEDIRFNLEMANRGVIDYVESPPAFFLQSRWQQFVQSASANTWFMRAVVALWMLVGFAALYLLSRNRSLRKVGFFAATGLLFVALLLFVIGFAAHRQLHGGKEAIVMVPNVYVKTSPDQEAKDQFILHEGFKVEVENEMGGWYYIRISDGNTGWLDTAAVAMI
jgi:tetratricopeptide (TPR) repeat protein